MCLFSGDRDSSSSFGKSDRGGGGGSYGAPSGDMEIQQDTIFVSGMGDDCTEEAMVQHFGSIGVIKVGHLCADMGFLRFLPEFAYGVILEICRNPLRKF